MTLDMFNCFHLAQICMRIFLNTVITRDDNTLSYEEAHGHLTPLSWLLLTRRSPKPGQCEPWVWYCAWKNADNIRKSLTHWGQVTYIYIYLYMCVSKVTIIGSDNGLSPCRHQTIIWTNAVILLIATLGTDFHVTVIENCTLMFKKMHLKLSSGDWRPFCLGLNVLNILTVYGSWFNWTGHINWACGNCVRRWIGHTARARAMQMQLRFHKKAALSCNFPTQLWVKIA